MPNTASMTTAGLAGVTIAQAVLHGLKKGGKLKGKLEKAKRAGLAWLLHEFSVRKNKGNGRHLHYYLYGLERSCEINQVALLGHRDWYFEGANLLVETQSRIGDGGAGSFRGAGLPRHRSGPPVGLAYPPMWPRSASPDRASSWPAGTSPRAWRPAVPA